MSKKLVVLFIALVTGWLWAQEASTSSSSSTTKRQLESTSSTSVSSTEKRIRRDSDETCELLATPHNKIIDRIAEDIDSVQKDGYIGIESPSFTNDTIKKKLIEAAQRGAKVRVFVNNPAQENYPHLPAVYDDLRSKNITVSVIQDLHAKRLIMVPKIPFEGIKVLYLGSLNMTQNSPHNYEIMVRCTDPKLFLESYMDQQRLGTDFYRTHGTQPVDFTIKRIINSFHPEAIRAKKRIIEEFISCTHPHDHLYFLAYTLDDPEFINAIIQARKQSNKSITVILDSKTSTNVLRQLVLANVDVYVFNKNQTERTPQGHPKSMHIKAIVRQCNQECLSIISTANFTQTGSANINHDLWLPCSLPFAEQFKRIIDNLKHICEKLRIQDYQSKPIDGTPQEMGKKILALMIYRDTTFANTDEILRLIRAGADLSQEDRYGATALIKAIESDHTQIVQALINAGANVNQISIDPENNRNRYTALQRAAQMGRTQFVNMLIEAGIKPTLNYSDEHGNTPLFMAVRGNHVNIVKALLEIGADPNIPGDYRESSSRWGHTGSIPPIVQAVTTRNIEIAQALIDSHADVNAVDREGFTAFLRATNMDDLPMIKLLARAGANIDVLHPTAGTTPLIQAISNGNIKLVTALLAVGADINAQDKYRKTAFDHAVGKPQILNLLNDVKFARENQLE